MLMPVPIVRIAASLALLASSASGQVPVAPAEPQAQEIVVTGSRAKSLDRKKLARALKAHRSGRSIYAPQSQLFFTMRPTPGAPGLEGLKLAIRTKTGVMPIEIEGGRRFVLPEQIKGKWKLVTNRTSDSFAIEPLVMSPGTSSADRLLGDLRLQCAVVWAMEKPDLPVWMRAFAGAFGGLCTGSIIPYFEWSDRAIAEASVSTGGVTKAVYVTADRHAFRPPVGDKTLPHTARVRFRYQ